MRKSYFVAVLALGLWFSGGGIAQAQTDVTSQYLTNADFSQGTPVAVNVCGYKGDISKTENKLNGENAAYWAQQVSGWDISSEQKDTKAGAVFAYGSKPKLCGNNKSAPDKNPTGEVSGNALGIFAVWGGSILYTQKAKADLEAGVYQLSYTYYNQSGTNAVENLIGFVEDGGTTHYGTTTSFTTGTWTTETFYFGLTSATSGKFSVGYTSKGSGSGANPMLFIDNIKLAKVSLDGSSYAHPSMDLLTNGSFDIANQGWTLNNMSYQNNKERSTQYIEKWDAKALSGTSTATQIIKNLPAGAYVLQGVVNTSQAENGAVTLSVNEQTVNCSGTWKDYEIVYNLKQAGDITVQFNSKNCKSNWIACDAFSLTYGGDYDTFVKDKYAGETEYNALNAAIKTAEDKSLGFEAGEYAPYQNVAALQALAAAKAIVQTDKNLKTAVEAATSALTSATWTANTTAVDAIYNGNFATVEDGQNYPKGWTRTNSWGQMRTDASTTDKTAYYNQPGSLVYGSRVGYTMPLKANTVYRLTFKYASWENNSNNGVTASVLNTSNEGLAATNYEGNKKKYTDAFVTKTAFFKTGAAGDYVLTLANNGNTVLTDVSLVKYEVPEVAISEDQTVAPAASEYANVTLNRTFNQNAWNTLVVPFDMTADQVKAAFGNDVKVASYKGATQNGDETYTLNFETTTSIKAGEPVFIYGATDAKDKVIEGVTIESVEGDPKAGPADAAFSFVGTYVKKTVTPGSWFINSENKLYREGDGQTTLKALRAEFRPTTEAAQAKGLKVSFDDGEATGISSVKSEEAGVKNSTVYTLSGQKVAERMDGSKLPAGLYIVGGKKVIVK